MSLCHVTYYLKIVVLRTFYFFSLKEPPPKRSCQSVTETSKVEATMSRQEKSPLIQQQVELSTSINLQILTFQRSNQTRAFQSKWLSEFPWLHYNELNDSALCFILLCFIISLCFIMFYFSGNYH